MTTNMMIRMTADGVMTAADGTGVEDAGFVIKLEDLGDASGEESGRGFLLVWLLTGEGDLGGMGSWQGFFALIGITGAAFFRVSPK